MMWTQYQQMIEKREMNTNLDDNDNFSINKTEASGNWIWILQYLARGIAIPGHWEQTDQYLQQQVDRASSPLRIPAPLYFFLLLISLVESLAAVSIPLDPMEDLLANICKFLNE